MPAKDDRPALLIVALSGRALAASARRCGWQPVVLDAFGDLDTRAAAVRWAKVPLRPDWRFEPDALLEAAARLAPPPVPLVYGAGFERDPALLERLAAGRELLGTPPAVLRRLADPFAFAEICARSGLDHPEVRSEPPADPARWLVKRRGGAGGGHVRPATGTADAPESEWYFQRRVRGVPLSLLFLADGRVARPLCCTRQWTAPGRGHRFSGVSLPRPVDPGVRARLAGAAVALTRAFGLRGFASLDALVDRGRVWILEVNARPTASFEPLELATGPGLFDAHVAAARGNAVGIPAPARAAANEIVFTPQALRVPGGLRWPDWARDRTPGGTEVPPGGPVATVVATAGTAREARARVRRRRDSLLATLRGLAAAPRERAA